MTKPLSDDQERCAFVAEMMKALGHPVRLRLVAVLCEGEENVGDLAARRSR